MTEAPDEIARLFDASSVNPGNAAAEVYPGYPGLVFAQSALRRETATEILRPVLPPARLDIDVHNIVTRASAAKNGRPAHRALPDALGEHERWLGVRQTARELIAALR